MTETQTPRKDQATDPVPHAGGVPLLALVLTPLPAAAADDEIAPFRLTGVEGYVSTRYIRDDYDSGQTGPASTGSTNQTHTDFCQELFVMTHRHQPERTGHLGYRRALQLHRSRQLPAREALPGRGLLRAPEPDAECLGGRAADR